MLRGFFGSFRWFGRLAILGEIFLLHLGIGGSSVIPLKDSVDS